MVVMLLWWCLLLMVVLLLLIDWFMCMLNWFLLLKWWLRLICVLSELDVVLLMVMCVSGLLFVCFSCRFMFLLIVELFGDVLFRNVFVFLNMLICLIVLVWMSCCGVMLYRLFSDMLLLVSVKLWMMNICEKLL